MRDGCPKTRPAFRWSDIPRQESDKLDTGFPTIRRRSIDPDRRSRIGSSRDSNRPKIESRRERIAIRIRKERIQAEHDRAVLEALANGYTET